MLPSEGFSVVIQHGDKTVPLGEVVRPTESTPSAADGYSISVEPVDVFEQNKSIEDMRKAVLDALQGQLVPSQASPLVTPELVSRLASSVAQHVAPMFNAVDGVDLQPSATEPGVYTFKAKMHTVMPVHTYAFEIRKPASMSDTEFADMCSKIKAELEAACQDT